AFAVRDGTWAERLPEREHGLALGCGERGVCVFALWGAATLVLPLAGWLAGRFGSREPAAIGVLLAAGALAAAAFVTGGGMLAVAAAALGTGFGIVDVAANAHGVGLERRLGRHVLSALHGMWSTGPLAGSGIAAG